MHLNYHQKRRRCGKAGCRTCQQAGGHGPYWYATQTINGKTVQTYIGRHLPTCTQETIGRTEQSPFVGREEELAHLLHLLETIEDIRSAHKSSSHPQIAPVSVHTVILTGETGLGKTRLAEEVAREAALRHWSVLWIGVKPERNAPYRLWAEMLRTALAQGLWKRLGVLRQPASYQPLHILLPEVLDLWPEGARPPEQLHLWEAVRLLLTTIGKKTCVLVVFDDLHGADSRSCELLAYLARRMQGVRILVLCTCCASEVPVEHPLHRVLTNFEHEQSVDMFSLAPLTNEQICALIPSVPAGLAERIALHTGGNPLFAEELARSSMAGDLVDVSHRTRPKDLPQTISAAFALRLAHLGAECQRLLECGAVLGQSFPFVALEAMSSTILHLDEETLIDLLEEAMQAGTIIEEGGGNAIVYYFWHPLLRTALYNRLTAVRRASLHRRAAQVLQELAKGREAEYAAQIANHLAQSGATPIGLPITPR